MAAAGLAVGILITPLVASIAEDAMYAVPELAARGVVRAGRAQAHDEHPGRGPRRPSRASWPRSSSGFSRALGETMIVAIAAGGVGGAVFNLNPCLPGQTMTAAMTALAIGSDQVAGRCRRSRACSSWACCCS